MVSRAGERQHRQNADRVPTTANRTCTGTAKTCTGKRTQPPSRTGAETASSRTKRESRPQRPTIWNCWKFGKCDFVFYNFLVDIVEVLTEPHNQKRKPKRATAFLMPTNGNRNGKSKRPHKQPNHRQKPPTMPKKRQQGGAVCLLITKVSSTGQRFS